MIDEDENQCAYCRNKKRAFIWLNTPDCFHEEYFYNKVSKSELNQYYQKRERKYREKKNMKMSMKKFIIVIIKNVKENIEKKRT